MREVMIADLKANLSAYLAAVRKGEAIVVCDRMTPIARIEPYAQTDDLVIVEAVGGPAEARKIKPVKLKKSVDVDKLLLELRADK